MTLSQSSEINLTDNGKRALNAQNTANNAYNLANGAQGLANGAQKTADGKNSVYRGTDPSTVPTAGLKEGDIYFTDNTLYTWNGSAWEETVSDTTGAKIKAEVEAATQEAQKASADLKDNIESKAKELDASIESTKTDMIAATNAVASDLSTTKSNLDAVSKDLSTTKSNMQSGLDSVNKDLSTTKSNLDAVSKDLSDTKSSTQSSLDAVNNSLSETKNDLANVSKDLSDTKSSTQSGLDAVNNSLSETKSDLANVSKDLSNTKSSTQSSLDAINNDLSTTKSNLGTVSNDLSETKSNLATVTDDLSKTKGSMQSGLDAVNKDLSTTKSDLATVSKDLTATKSNLGTVSNDLSETKNNLADTGQKLATAVSNFQKTTDQLSGSLETANSKIEFNSNAISEVKHTADGISTTVSSGGRNLIPQAGNFSTDYWAIASGGNGQGFFAKLDVTLPDSLKSDNILTILGNTQGNRDWVTTTYDVNVVKGQTYTFSVYVKLNANTGVADPMIQFRMWGKNTNHQTWGVAQNGLGLSKTAWKRVSFTAVASDSDFSRPAFGIVGQSSIDFAFPQFEVGGMATPWQPSGNDISTLRQTADAIRADLTNTKGDVASVQATAKSLQSQITDNKNNISSVKQTADSLTTRMTNAEGNVSSLQQTAKGLESTVGQMPTQWQQAINDKANAQVLTSGVDMNNLTTAGTYLIKDSNVKNAPIPAYFMATVEATADGYRVVQRVKRDTSSEAYERSNMNTGWTAWERVATGTDISTIQQTINGITTRVGNAEGNVSSLQQTAKSIQSSVTDNANNISKVQQTTTELKSDLADAKGNISSLQQTANGLTSRVGSAEGNISSLQQTATNLQSTISDHTGKLSQLQQDADKITTTVRSGGVNLLSNSKGKFQPAKSIVDNWVAFNNTNVYLEQGKKYTISAQCGPDGFYFSGSHVPTKESQCIVLWLVNSGKNINQVISSDTTDFSQGGTHFTWDYPSDTYTLRVNSYDTQNRGYAYNVQVECGETATPWKPKSDDTDQAISKVSQTADSIRADLTNTQGDVASVKATASSLQSQITDNKNNISSVKQTADSLTTRMTNAEGNVSSLQQTAKGLQTTVQDQTGKISQLQQDADGLSATVGGASIDIIPNLDKQFVMGYGFANTTWQDGNSYIQLPTTKKNNEVLPQTAGFTLNIPWQTGKTYMQSIIFETDATINDSVQPQWTWYAVNGHFIANATLSKLGNNTYRLIGSHTPTAQEAAKPLRIFDISNFTNFVNVTTGTYLKFRNPRIWCPDDNSLAQLKLTADGLTSKVADTQDNVSKLQQTSTQLTSDMKDAKSNVSDLQQTANSLTSDVANAKGDISQLQQTASGLTSRVGSAEGNISQLQQTANEISTTVSNIRVGGRNLLTNTRTLSDVWQRDTETIDGFTVAKATKTGGDYYDPLQWYHLTVKPNTDYVLTFYAKASTQTTIRSHLYDIGTEGYYNDGLTPNTLTTDYQRYVVKFHTGDVPAGRLVNCIPVRLFNNVTAWIYGVQLEEGNTATQWQPNPDDTDQAISKVSQTADAIRADLTNTQGDVASVKATASSLQSQITDNKNNISSVQQTADSLTTRMSNTEGNVSSLQQTASGLTSRVGSAEGNISQLQQTASGLTSTVGQMPTQWQQAINDKANAQVLTSGVDMNNLTTAGTYLVKDSQVKNSPLTTWFMAFVEATADGLRVVQRVKKDTSSEAYERSNANNGQQWTAWERMATGTDISTIQQTINGITTRVGNAEGNVSTLQQTSKDLTTRVGNTEGNISQLQQTADGLSATVKGGRNQLNNTSSTLQTVTVHTWARYVMSNDEPIAKHQLDGQKVTLSAWIENPSKEAWVQMWTDKGMAQGNRIPAGGSGWSQVTYTMPSGFSNWNIVVGCGDGSGTVMLSYSSLQLELGPNRTAWSQSTADIAQLKITANSLSSDIADAKGNISQLKQTANGLTTRVGDAEGNISSLQQTSKGLESRVGSAEGNISSLQQDSKGLTTRVGNAEGNISQLQQTSDSLTSTLKNGGSNLLNGTSDTEITNTYPTSGFSDKKYYKMSVPANQTDYVLSFDAKATVAGDKILCYMYAPNQVTKAVSSQNRANNNNDGSTVFDLTTDWGRYWVHYTITPTYQSPTIIVGRTVPGGSGTVSFKCVQLECGSTPTPWSPSTGDISQLQQTATQLTIDMKDAKGNISSFQQTAGGLTSRVGSAEDNISQLQQDSKGLTSRVGSAESNISQLQQTASGLTSTVSNMKSGGANMLPAGTLASYFSSTVTYDASTDTYTVVNPASVDSSWGSGVALPNACIEVPWGQTACISMQVYTPTAGTMNVDINNGGDGVTGGNDNDNRNNATFHNMNVPANEWTTVWFTYENSSLNRNPKKVSLWDVKTGIGLKLNSVTWKVRHPVVQLGTFPSGWSPSPKDTDSAVSQIKQTADGITAYVKGSKGSQTLSSLLSMDPNNSTIAQVVNGKPVAAINLSSEGDALITGKKIKLDGDVTIDGEAFASKLKATGIRVDQLVAGSIDASKIDVINLDANSITTGSFSAVLGKNLTFKTYTVSPSSIWDFNYTKSNYGNWFLNGETTADHVYNGPRDTSGNKITPFMYVSSRGVGDSYVVTVWKDYDPTQYQRVWIHDHWTNWVMLPNSQNIVSVINLSPDGVTINGKNIELNGNTTIHGQLNLLPKDQQTVSQFGQDLHNPWSWKDSKVFAGTGGIQLQSTVTGQQYSNDYTSVGGLVNGSSPAITTLSPTYLKFTLYKSWGDFNNKYSNQLARTYIDAGRIETNDVFAGGIRLSGSKIRGLNGSVYVANFNGTNFDNAGGVGFQVWGGIGLGQSTIYTPDADLYVQQGNVGPALGQSYSSSGKTQIHCQKVISQVANTVSSRLSVKTAITKVDYDRALMAVQNTDMYDYRYTTDDSGQHYVSGIIDDIHDKPEYSMDPMLINQEKTARIDANLLGYHHVVLQEMLKEIEQLKTEIKQLKAK